MFQLALPVKRGKRGKFSFCFETLHFRTPRAFWFVSLSGLEDLKGRNIRKKEENQTANTSNEADLIDHTATEEKIPATWAIVFIILVSQLNF